MFLTDLADVLRAYRAPDGSGLEVVEVDGWKTRTFDGNGMAGNIGVVHHHTATALSAYTYSDAPTLGLIVNGRSDLPGPLANLVFGRSGTVYVVAAGEANHAGAGNIPGVGYNNLGNYYMIGIEAESSGVVDDWTEAQRRIWPHLAAALDEGYSGGSIYYQLGHREYSSQGKIDPSFIDLDVLRSDINKLLEGGTIATQQLEEVAMSVNEFLDAPIKDYRTGGDTTVRAEVGWLPQNFKVTNQAIEGIPQRVLNQPIKRNGESQKGKQPTSLGLEVSYLADNFQLLLSQLKRLEDKIDRLEKGSVNMLALVERLSEKSIQDEKEGK